MQTLTILMPFELLGLTIRSSDCRNWNCIYMYNHGENTYSTAMCTHTTTNKQTKNMVITVLLLKWQTVCFGSNSEQINCPFWLPRCQFQWHFSYTGNNRIAATGNKTKWLFSYWACNWCHVAIVCQRSNSWQNGFCQNIWKQANIFIKFLLWNSAKFCGQ